MTERKRVLVTGAGGFTGAYLGPLLESRGYEVVGTTHGQASPTLENMDLTQVDQIRNVVQTARPHFVIHLAALSFVAHPTPLDFYQINTIGTELLLKALAELPTTPEKVILASTSNVYGNQPTDIIDESLCPAPPNHYGNSKLAMEHQAANWFDRLPILITRPFNYTGPGQEPRFLVPKMVDHLASRQPSIELGNLDVSRDISDVRDICEYYIKLMECSARSQVVNLCSGRDTVLQELLQTLCSLAGYSIEVKINPAFVRTNDIKRLRGSRNRLQSLVGPLSDRPLSETLSDMLKDASAR